MKTGMNLLLWTTHVTAEHFPLLAKLKNDRLRRCRDPALRRRRRSLQNDRRGAEEAGPGLHHRHRASAPEPIRSAPMPAFARPRSNATNGPSR